MELLICIDDTDNEQSKGTGHLAAAISEAMVERGWGRAEPVTRHQLFVHPDVPYTSHNSAMCFVFSGDGERLRAVISHARERLRQASAPGSDPGLCVVNREALADGDVADLIAFGKSAKSRVLCKRDAYALAQRVGFHLSEHGGTGGGVIGAVAGAGLRLSGNDGRFRGHFQLGEEGARLSVAEIKARTPVEVVQRLDGALLTDADAVVLGPKVKAVLLNRACTLLVCRAGPSGATEPSTPWHTCSKEQLRSY